MSQLPLSSDSWEIRISWLHLDVGLSNKLKFDVQTHSLHLACQLRNFQALLAAYLPSSSWNLWNVPACQESLLFRDNQGRRKISFAAHVSSLEAKVKASSEKSSLSAANSSDDGLFLGELKGFYRFCDVWKEWGKLKFFLPTHFMQFSSGNGALTYFQKVLPKGGTMLIRKNMQLPCRQQVS